MSSFGKIHRRNGSFLASDIFLDCLETIRVTGGDSGTINGLEFIVPSTEARITDHWRGRVNSQTCHFHVISLQNKLRFPLSKFVLELLYDYDIAPLTTCAKCMEDSRGFLSGVSHLRGRAD